MTTPRLKTLICFFKHDWHIHCLADKKGHIVTFEKICERCNKSLTLQPPEEYNPSDYVWADKNHIPWNKRK